MIFDNVQDLTWSSNGLAYASDSTVDYRHFGLLAVGIMYIDGFAVRICISGVFCTSKLTLLGEGCA